MSTTTTATIEDLAARHVRSRGQNIARLGPSADWEVRHAYTSGYSAAKNDPNKAAPLVKAARDRERARIKAIIELPEAKGREAMARQLAFGTDLTADQARAMLASAPAERGGLIDPKHDKLLRAALRGAGVRSEAGVLELAMAAEGGPALRGMPVPAEATRAVTAIDGAAIFESRRKQAEAAGRRPA